MTRFRPCIDLHNGKVKQIVGGSLRDDGAGPKENFVAEHGAAWFAARYREDGLAGGHVIKLGPGNDEPAKAAVSQWPGGLQVGGGIDSDNATAWLDAGASHVIVTSWLFDEQGRLQQNRLERLVHEVGREKIVLDLSCRRNQKESANTTADLAVNSESETDEVSADPTWTVAMNRWQTPTELNVDHDTLDFLSGYASEFLIHAADVEGLCQGVDLELVKMLGQWHRLPITYAGGAATMDDVEQVAAVSDGQVDITVGSALDLFGGSGIHYDDLVRWNQRQ